MPDANRCQYYAEGYTFGTPPLAFVLRYRGGRTSKSAGRNGVIFMGRYDAFEGNSAADHHGRCHADASFAVRLR